MLIWSQECSVSWHWMGQLSQEQIRVDQTTIQVRQERCCSPLFYPQRDIWRKVDETVGINLNQNSSQYKNQVRFARIARRWWSLRSCLGLFWTKSGKDTRRILSSPNNQGGDRYWWVVRSLRIRGSSTKTRKRVEKEKKIRKGPLKTTTKG